MTDTYSYTNDRLTSTSSKSFGYDSNGNIASVTVGGNTTSLTYDYENRVTQITYPNSSTNTFKYNGLGLRTQKIDSAGTFNYVTDGADVASPVLNDSAATYTPGLSERRGSTSKFYHSDALGSTRGITNTTQSATDGILYDAFGMTVGRTGTTPTPFGFVGRSQYQSDADSGLMLLGHRYYDCSIGRFITSDSAHAGNNLYMYCGNNALNAFDPMGLFQFSIGLGGSAILPGIGMGGDIEIVIDFRGSWKPWEWHIGDGGHVGAGPGYGIQLGGGLQFGVAPGELHTGDDNGWTVGVAVDDGIGIGLTTGGNASGAWPKVGPQVGGGGGVYVGPQQGGTHDWGSIGKILGWLWDNFAGPKG